MTEPKISVNQSDESSQPGPADLERIYRSLRLIRRAEEEIARIYPVLTTGLNGGRYLQETLDSVAAQTFTNFEHIVVDGASRDDSVAPGPTCSRRAVRAAEIATRACASTVGVKRCRCAN